MDTLLRQYQQQARIQPTDVETLQRYISALERAMFFTDSDVKDQPLTDQSTPKLYLVSGSGDRHEDRHPVAIFTSEGAAIRAMRASIAATETRSAEHGLECNVGLAMQTYEGDYGPLIELSGPTGEDQGWGFRFLVEPFPINPDDLGPIC